MSENIKDIDKQKEICYLVDAVCENIKKKLLNDKYYGSIVLKFEASVFSSMKYDQNFTKESILMELK